MCTNPIQIYNRSSKISYRGQSLLFTVPCGKCEECKKAHSNEYTLRSYFEYRDCESKGGYVYFDTLTYNNRYLPKNYGIAHFSRKHLVSCLKKLRVYLTRAGFIVKDNLKYFITSEYGGNKHRPHYHVLFFINIPNLDVKTFWQFLNKAWIYGFCDRYNTCQNRIVNSTAALNYVSKYVQKDQEWQTVVDQKIARLSKIGLDAHFQEHLKDYQPFHIQSQHYGANFLKFTNLDDILRQGFIQIPDRKYLIKNYAIPTYYKRILFYYKERTADNKYIWHLNSLGICYKSLQLDNIIDNQYNKIQSTLDNLKAYNTFESFDLSVVPRLIAQYLGTRTLRDFVIYSTVYRNRLWSSTKPLPSYSEFYRLSLDEGTIDSRLYDTNLSVRSSYRSRLDQYKITQYRYQEFKDFDNLYYLLKAITDYFNLLTDKETKRKQSVRDRLALYLKPAI